MKIEDYIPSLLFTVSAIPLATFVNIAMAAVPLLGALVAFYYNFKKHKREEEYHKVRIDLKKKMVEMLDDNPNITPDEILKIINALNS